MIISSKFQLKPYGDDDYWYENWLQLELGGAVLLVSLSMSFWIEVFFISVNR